MYICIYVYVCVCICIYIYIYVYEYYVIYTIHNIGKVWGICGPSVKQAFVPAPNGGRRPQGL